MADTEDRLLVGEALDGEPSPDAVTAFLGDARGALVEPPGEEAAADHLRAMARAAQTEPAAAPPRRPALARLRPSLTAGVAVAALAGSVTLGAFGALPAPVQAALADASQVVGVEVPEPEPSDAAKEPGATGGSPNSSPRSAGPPVERVGQTQPAPSPPSAPAREANQAESEPASEICIPVCEAPSDELPIGDDADPWGPSPSQGDEGPEHGLEEQPEPATGDGPEAGSGADPRPEADDGSATG